MMQSFAIQSFAYITTAVLLFPAIAAAQIRSLQVPEVSGRSYNVARFSPDGKLIAVAVKNDRGVLADASFGAAAVVGDAAESVEDGTTDLSLFRDAMKGLPEKGGIGIWELATGRLVSWLSSDEFNRDAAEDIEFSPSGKLLAALGMGDSKVVPIWDPSTGKLVSRLTTEYTFGADLSFSPSGNTIAVTYTRGELDIFDVASGLVVSELDGNRMRDSVFYSRDGKRLASGFCVWDVKSEQQIAKSDKYYIGDQFVFSADGSKIYGIETRKTPAKILCWDIATGKLTAPFEATMRDTAQVGLNYLTLSPSGEFFATAGMDATAKVWSVRTGQLLASFEARPRQMIQMGFNPGAAQEVRHVEFSPDGKLLLSSSWDGMIQFWDLSKLVSAGGNRSVLRVNRMHLGEELIDEEVSNPGPVEPVGQAVALKAELPVGSRVLVRTPENKWLAGYVLRTHDDGRVDVHPAGYSSKADLTVTRSRLLIP